MTHHPEGVFIRDAAGKTPMDYAKALPAHRKLEVVKALKQGPLLSAVSKAAMQRASTNNSIRQHLHETQDSVSVATMEARVKEAEAKAEKTYAGILSNLEAKHQKQIEQNNLEAESRQKAMEGKFLVLIEEAKAEAKKEHDAFVALELSYEADVAAAKKEAEKHKEQLTVSSRKLQALEESGDCLTVSTLPLRQKLKAVRAELEEEWQNNSELTKENESLKKSKTEAEAKLEDQEKSIEAMKTDLADASEKLELKESTIAELRDDISKKAAHIEELVATIAGLETELTDQETEIDTITKKLRETKQEIDSRDSTISDLNTEISKKETRVEELVAAKTALENELDQQKNEIEVAKTDLRASAEELESRDSTIADLRNEISKKEAHVDELVANIAGLENELVDQEKEMDAKLEEAKQEKKALETELATASENMESNVSTIIDLKDELAKKEARAEELLSTIAGLESELVDQEKETEAAVAKHQTATEELGSMAFVVNTLENTIMEKETHAEQLDATITHLQHELNCHKTETEGVAAELLAAKEEIDSKDTIINDLENTISDKEAELEEVVSTNVNLGIELNDQLKVTKTLSTKLHAATQDIDAKESMIADLQYDITEKESRVIELKQELADAKKEIESKACTINEQEGAVLDLAEKNQEMEEVKSRLNIATEEILLKASMISMLDARHMEKESHCEQLTRELEDLKPKLESEMERSATLAQNVSELAMKKTGLELELKENIVDLEMTKEKIAQVTTELEEKTVKIGELEGVISEQKAACEGLNVQLDELRLEHKNEQHRAGALEEKVQALEADKVQLEGEVAAKVEDVDRHKSRMYEMIEEIEMKSSKINGLEVLLENEEARCEDLNNELDEVKTELESAQTQVTSLTENLSKTVAAKESLEVDLKEREAKLEEIETNLNATAEERELKISDNLMLEGLLSDKHAEVEDLSAQLKAKQAEAERALVLEQELDKTSNDLASVKARSEELRLEITQLTNRIASANLEIRKYKMRAKTVEKWVSSFALSIQGWRLEQENPDDVVITNSTSNLITEIEEEN